jgi:hypothetical protein
MDYTTKNEQTNISIDHLNRTHFNKNVLLKKVNNNRALSTFALDKNLMKLFKRKCLDNNVSMKEQITQLIQTFLNEK